ncbi:MAG: universal stress protein [Nitrospirae bacterium YQR-1]
MVLKKFSEKMDKMFTAVTFAEEGEFDTAREFMMDSRRVLLAITENSIDRKTLLYTINTCKRINAELDILYLSKTNEMNNSLQTFLSELDNEGIKYRLIVKTGSLRSEIVAYTESNKEILYVIVDSSDNWDTTAYEKERDFPDLFKNLRCPLVVIKESAVRT